MSGAGSIERGSFCLQPFRALPPPMTDMSVASGESADRQLVRRFLRSRSERSFLRLYDNHAQALYRMALRLASGAGAEAEEIVQETWIRAVQGLADFGWHSTLRTWLIGIAVNVARERRRRQTRNQPRPALQVVEGGRSPGAKLDLERAIAGLSPAYREVLLLHDVEGYTHREVGQMLGIDEGSSKSRLSRARRVLRERLAARGGRVHVRRP